MSKQLLRTLNGNNKGNFNRWLNDFEGEPRIAWYPSANEDFTPLLYLSPSFAETFKIRQSLTSYPETPDIFIYTDYFPGDKNPRFLNDGNLRRDDHTEIAAKVVEELPRCDLPLDRGIVDFPEGGVNTGRVFHLEVEIESDVGGKFSTSVIYAFVENNAFYRMRILPDNAVISHVFRKRMGGGWAGGNDRGDWLLKDMWGLGCECIVTDMDQHDLKTNPYLHGMDISSAISDDSKIDPKPMIGLPPYLITKLSSASDDNIDGKPVNKQILMVPPWLGIDLDDALESL